MTSSAIPRLGSPAFELRQFRALERAGLVVETAPAPGNETVIRCQHCVAMWCRLTALPPKDRRRETAQYRRLAARHVVALHSDRLPAGFRSIQEKAEA